MFIRRRIKQYQLINNGLTLMDKAKLLVLSLFYTLPNSVTNMNAETPQSMIELSKGILINLNGRIYKLSHPRQMFMISDQYERVIQPWFNVTGDTFLDIGANIGKYTIKLAYRFKHIHAFEPTPETNQILKYNLTVNGLEHITVHPLAVWNKNEVLTFYLKNNPGGNSASYQTDKSYESIKIQAVKLDDMMNSFNKVDLVKIDIEGAEVEALEGMKELLKRDKPRVIVEVLEENREPVYNLMFGLGYTLINNQHRNHLFDPA